MLSCCRMILFLFFVCSVFADPKWYLVDTKDNGASGKVFPSLAFLCTYI